MSSCAGLSYELGINGGEKVNGNWDITKNRHLTFRTGKPGNVNSLRELV